MSKTKLRIVQDFVDFNNNKPDGIYLYINQNDIFNNYALIVGPKDTPYFGGFYFFKINFPSDYPNKPPSVTLLTLHKDVRFNPNLYESGRVCLSILGTWVGPNWKKVMNLRLVLLSISSLLNEYPIINEPGFEETKDTDTKSIDYNHYLIYYNYKVAIIDIINNIENTNMCYHFFKEDILKEFKKNYKELSDSLKSYQITIGEKCIGKIIYFIKKEHLIDFINLNTEFQVLYNIDDTKCDTPCDTNS